MEGPPLGPGGEDITWPDQVAPWGQKASSTRKIKPQTSNHWGGCVVEGIGGACCRWLWCGVSSRTCLSPGVWLVFWCFGLRVCASVAVCVAV